MKDTFVFHLSWMDVLNEYPSDVKYEVYDAIIEYVQHGTQRQLTPLAKMAFSFIKRDIDTDIQRYKQVCRTNRTNGMLGGRPKKPSGFPETDGFLKNRTKPKKPDNDYDNDYDDDNDDDIEIEKENIIKEKEKKLFLPPSVEEIRLYCQERDNDVDPDKFFNFYQSKGWYVGKTKMKDWKAAVRTWERKNNSKRQLSISTNNVDYTKTAMQRRQGQWQ